MFADILTLRRDNARANNKKSIKGIFERAVNELVDHTTTGSK